MLNRLLIGLLTFVFMIVQANAATGDSLKKVFDEYNYAMKVEWDQKDQGFYNTQKEKLARKLGEIRQGGVSQSEITQFALTQIKDKNLAKQIEGTLNLVKLGTLSDSEANSIILEAVTKSQSSGASWSSDSSVGIVLLMVGIIAAMITLILVFGCKGEWVPDGTFHEECDTYCNTDPNYPDDCIQECYQVENVVCEDQQAAVQ